MIFHYDIEAKHFPEAVFLFWLEQWEAEWDRQHCCGHLREMMARLDEKILALQPAEDWGTLDSDESDGETWKKAMEANLRPSSRKYYV